MNSLTSVPIRGVGEVIYYLVRRLPGLSGARYHWIHRSAVHPQTVCLHIQDNDASQGS